MSAETIPVEHSVSFALGGVDSGPALVVAVYMLGLLADITVVTGMSATPTDRGWVVGSFSFGSFRLGSVTRRSSCLLQSRPRILVTREVV